MTIDFYLTPTERAFCAWIRTYLQRRRAEQNARDAERAK